MSVYTNDWAQLDNNGNTGGNGIVSVCPLSYNNGRQGRYEEYFYIDGSNDRCTIEVSQDGRPDFVSFEESGETFDFDNIPYDETSLSFIFSSNSKYLAFTLGGGWLSIDVIIVDEDLNGVWTPYTLDSNDQIEIDGDPGRFNKYLVAIRLVFSANTEKTDRTGYLSIVGFSGNGELHDTLVENFVQAAAP